PRSAVTVSAPSLLQSQYHLGDAEVDDEAGGVDQRRDERRREDRRVHAEALGGDGDERAHGGGPGAYRQHRDGHGDGQRHVRAPEQGAAGGQAPDQQAHDDAGGGLAAQDPPGVFQPDLPQGDAPDDGGHRLRARVAAGPDEERDEERQGHHRGQLALVVPEHRPREGLGHEEEEQP